MSEPCGCRVSQPNQMIDPVVKFCPLHAAAEEMGIQLQWSIGVMKVAAEILSYFDREQAVNVVLNQVARSQQAIDRALGKQEPADDSEMPLGPIKAPARGLES